MEINDITIIVEDEETAQKRVQESLRKFDAGDMNYPRNVLSFRSVKLFRHFLTDKRIEILKTIRKHHPKSIYELSKILGRDRKSVTTDIKVLEDLGLVELKNSRSEGNRKITIPNVPYDRINISMEV